MALDTSIITEAFAHIRDNRATMSQSDQDTYLAGKLKAFVESATVTYTTSSLSAPSGGGVVFIAGTSGIATLS